MQPARLVNGTTGTFFSCILTSRTGFPGGSAGKNLSANAGDVSSIPGWGSSPGEGNGNPLQCSCLGNPMDRGAWWATVHGTVEWDTAEHTHTDHHHPGFPESSHSPPPPLFPLSNSHPLPPFSPWWIVSLWVSLRSGMPSEEGVHLSRGPPTSISCPPVKISEAASPLARVLDPSPQLVQGLALGMLPLFSH